MITKFKIYESVEVFEDFFYDEDSRTDDDVYYIVGFVGFKNHIITFEASKDSEDYWNVDIDDDNYNGFSGDIADEYESEIIDYIKEHLYGNSLETPPTREYREKYIENYNMLKSLNKYKI